MLSRASIAASVRSGVVRASVAASQSSERARRRTRDRPITIVEETDQERYGLGERRAQRQAAAQMPGSACCSSAPRTLVGWGACTLAAASTATTSVGPVYLDEIRKAGLYDAIWQAFAVLLPVRTVGVMGDGRTYDQACALRAVTSTDGMTADYYPFEHAFLGRVAARIINEVRGINRVTYDITSKPPGTIEWE